MQKFIITYLLATMGSIVTAFGQGETSNAQLEADTLLNQKLEAITISGTSKAGQYSPFSFQNLDSRYIGKVSIGQEPAFLFQQTPAVTAYSDGGYNNGYAYIRMRGIDQTRINITLEGMPLNDSEDQGFYFANFPDFLNSIGNAQIQRGVGMTKNGTASYGGSIQFDALALTDTFGLTMGANYGSFNTYRLFAALQTGKKNNMNAYFRLSQQHSDGYKYHSANTGQSIFANIGWQKNKHSLRLMALLGHQINNGLAWLGASEQAINLDRRTNANSMGETDDFMQSFIQLQHRYFMNHNTTWRSGIYGMYSNGNYFFDYNNFIDLPSTGELYNYDFNGQMGGVFSQIAYGKGNHTLSAGIHANTYKRRHIGSLFNTDTLMQWGKTVLYQNNGIKNDISAFVKYEYETGKWLLHTDWQYRYAAFRYDGNAQIPAISWQFLNPKVGVTYKIKPNAAIYYSIGGTGREPTRNDMFYGNDDLPTDTTGVALLGSTAPEYVVNHELGYRINKPKWQMGANVYFMRFRNEIVLNGQFGPNGLALTNSVKRSTRSGIELDNHIMLGKYAGIRHAIAYNYSRITVLDTANISFSPILTPTFIANQTLYGKYKGFEMDITTRYQSESYIDFANANTLPDFFTTDLSLSYQRKKWLFGIKVYNVFNTKYYSNGYVDYNGINRYFVQAPTYYNASVNWTF